MHVQRLQPVCDQVQGEFARVLSAAIRRGRVARIGLQRGAEEVGRGTGEEGCGAERRRRSLEMEPHVARGVRRVPRVQPEAARRHIALRRHPEGAVLDVLPARREDDPSSNGGRRTPAAVGRQRARRASDPRPSRRRQLSSGEEMGNVARDRPTRSGRDAHRSARVLRGHHSRRDVTTRTGATLLGSSDGVRLRSTDGRSSQRALRSVPLPGHPSEQ